MDKADCHSMQHVKALLILTNRFEGNLSNLFTLNITLFNINSKNYHDKNDHNDFFRRKQ